MSTTTATTGPSALSALLSLSNAAAASPPIPLSTSLSLDTPSTQQQLQGKSTPIPITSPTMSKKDVMTQGGNSKQGALKHRRLSSTGQARRRMSDARDAAASVGLRPGVHSTASAFASLTLSSSASSPPPPPPHNNHHGHSHSHSLSDVKNMTSTTTTTSIPIAVPTTPSSRRALAKSVPTASLVSSPPDARDDDIEVDVEDDEGDGEIDGGDDNDNDDDEKPRGGGGGGVASKTSTSLPATANTTKSAKPGKKRGNIYRCESCSKVYRHPSCLVKHRWEHSPHWREASKLMLSKHQQVQLLEAAAILSHLQPGSSLPEDRSLWPSYLSGGLLPPPSTTNIPINSSTSRNKTANSNGKDVKVSSPVLSANGGVGGGDAVSAVSSSVPANSTFGMVTRARSGSTSQTLTNSAAASGTGPRMHDYKLPTRQSGITQIRPGIIGMANPASASPPPASSTTTTPHGIVAVGAKPSAVPITQGYSSYAYGNSYRDTSGVSVSVSSVSGSVSVGGASLGESYGVRRRLEDDDEDYENGQHSYSYGDSSERVSDERGRRYDQDNDVGAGGWSLPRSDIRSGSRSGSGSGSRSGSRSDEEESDVDIDVDVTNKHVNGGYHHTNGHGAGHGYGYRSGLTGGYGGNHAYGNGYGNGHANGGWKREEDDAFAYGLDERDEMEYEYGKEREREREREEQERRKGLRAHEEEWVDGMDVDF